VKADEAELPWRNAGLLEVADLIRGVSYKRDEARREPGSGLVPVLRANNINGATLNFADLVYVPEHRVSEEQRIRRGDIVLAMSSGSRDVVGKAALARDDWPGGFGAFCGVLRTRPGIDARYLARFLQSAEYRRQIDSIATGTNINNLSKSTLTSIELPIAPHEIQGPLSALLDAIEEKRSAGALAHLVAAKRAVDRLRQAALAAACSGRLTSDWRGEHADEAAAGKLLSSLVDQQSHTGKRRIFDPYEYPPLRESLPAGWAIASPSQICPAIVDCPHSTPKYGAGSHYALDTTCMSDRGVEIEKLRLVTEESFRERNRRLEPHPGDVVFGREGTVGTAVVLPESPRVCLGQRVMLLRAGSGVLPEFLRLALMSPQTRGQYADRLLGTTVAHINVGDVIRLALPLPSSEEQAEIVRRAEQLLALADGLTRRIELTSKRVGRSSQAVLAKAFRGELRLAGVDS
jgi:type I restriction enzyme S subunit